MGTYLVILLLFCCSAIHVGNASESEVPVLIWSNDRGIVTDDNVFAGEFLDVQDVQKFLLPLFSGKPRTICLFMQNRLSLNDVAKFGHAYGYERSRSSFYHLKNVIQNAKSSLTLPSVANSGALKEFLSKAASGKAIELTANEAKNFNFNDHHFDNDAINVLVVRLPSVPESNSKEVAAVFKKNDEIIDIIMKEVGDHVSTLTGIFTGAKPSKEVEDSFIGETADFYHASGYIGRRLQKATEVVTQHYTTLITNDTFFVNVSNCVYIYATNFVFGFYKPALNVSLMSLQPSAISAECDMKGLNNTSLELSYNNLKGPLKDLRISMTFQRSDHMFYWKCIQMDVTYDWKQPKHSISGTENYTTQTELMAPYGYSYACHKPQVLSDAVLHNGSYVRFVNLQIQPMAIDNNKFSYASNCVGFFTAAIWMGLVVSVVLIAILYVGVLCTMYVKTMDRFEDAKGAGITINISN